MAEGGIRECIEGLRDFRRRSDAIRDLVAAGGAAVAPLLEALSLETHEGARWAILRCLAELKAQEAVGGIAPLLVDPQVKGAAHEALVQIVGEDMGMSPQPWLKWAQERGPAARPAAAYGAEMHMTGLPDARMVELALRGSGAAWREQGTGRFAVEVPCAGAVQEVSLILSAKDHEGAPIAIVYAECGPASPEHYEYALRRNLRMPYGALAIRDVGGRPQFVMFNTLLREDMSPLELRKSILAVAERAARVRQELKGDRKPDAEPPAG